MHAQKQEDCIDNTFNLRWNSLVLILNVSEYGIDLWKFLLLNKFNFDVGIYFAAE